MAGGGGASQGGAAVWLRSILSGLGLTGATRVVVYGADAMSAAAEERGRSTFRIRVGGSERL